MLKKRFLLSAVVLLVALVATVALASIAVAQTGDTTAPVVTNVVPANGSTIYTNSGSTIYYQNGNTTPMVIKADYSDEAGGSGVDPASVMVHLDGMNMLDNCPVQTDVHVECVATAADLAPGVHPLDVYVADMSGNLTVNHTSVTIALDSQAPAYANLAPAGGSIIHTSQLNSTAVNDPAALRIDYDLSDAAPSSGYSPMTHINDSVPPGVAGAMISNSSCVKTPATNPTHYSCQMNRASLLHLGNNTLSILLKDKVGNTSSDYTNAAARNYYTVVDDVAPAISGVTADGTTISGNFADPTPTGALGAANLASGISSGTAMVHVDGAMIMSGCTVTSTSISCPTPAGLADGTHTIEVMVADNSGNTGTGTGSLIVCTPAKPALSVTRGAVYWGSYADYTARTLTVKLIIKNNGAGTAYGVSFTGSTATNGVLLTSGTPLGLSDLTAGASVEFPVSYLIPPGVSSFKTSVTASASDACGSSYTYP